MITDKKGFTLIEVMVAMVIFGMTLMAATAMNLMTIKCNTGGNMMTEATMLAREKMEECQTKAWELEDGTYTDNLDGIYSRTWVITPHTSRSKRVTVYVAFAPAMGTPKRATINSIVGVGYHELNNGKLTDGSTTMEF